MNSQSDPTSITAGPATYRARWIVPVDGPPIENGFVSCKDGLIESVTTSAPVNSNVTDMGDVAIIPGLVNAHTHLEFSDLEKPVGNQGIDFTSWIREVVKQRIQSSSSAESKPNAIRAGLAESRAAGVVALGEIATAPYAPTDYHDCEVDITVFYEVLGRDPAVHESRVSELADAVKSTSRTANISPAVSPHAPYSISDALMSASVDLVLQSSVPIAMHLAETRDELRLLSDVEGPFVDLLKDFGVWIPESHRADSTILGYLKLLAQCPRSLIIHGNYLSRKEIDFVAAHAQKMSVVYCPRTHQYFDHDRYPLAAMRGQGINVAIGTDSRASSPDLNLMSDIRLVRELFPDVDAQQILATGTINGAIALGINKRLGSIAQGKIAAINLCTLPDPNDWQSLFDRTSTVKPI